MAGTRFPLRGSSRNHAPRLGPAPSPIINNDLIHCNTDARPHSFSETKYVLSARHPLPVMLEICQRMVG